ncbi:MAG: pyridoxamine 5'-phosphate oxidase family protein [Proteobacteria bacterium]|nr:pyridoxamine 5'-phosphate oxidase family protein [Pseudomonadota bacterium]
MDAALKARIVSVIEAGQDLTLATLRPDGAPQATTVSYASDGLDIYFGCGAQSQKARNLAHDSRVSLTITLPYRVWDEIRGISAFARARRLETPDELARAGALFLKKFPGELEQHLNSGVGEMIMFRLTLEIVSLLDYARGFGHTELARGEELAPA